MTQSRDIKRSLAEQLPSEQHTSDVLTSIKLAAAVMWGDAAAVDYVFEHGQWWVKLRDAERHGEETIFNVIDASPGLGGTEFDFTQV